MKERSIWSIAVMVAATLCAVVISVACGNAGVHNPSGTSAPAAANNSGASSVAIGSVLAEVSRYNVPEGVDEDVFEALRSELINGLAESGQDRIPAGAPTGDAGAVTDLTYDHATGNLVWSYKNTGDYDLSGDVGIPDITPIAQNYMAMAPEGSYEAWIDGDASGEVGISDITPIANGYLNAVSEYAILTSSTEGGTFTEIGRANFEEAKAALPPDAEFPIVFEVALPVGAEAFIAVQPVDGSENPGEMSAAMDWEHAGLISCIDCHTDKEMLIATAEPEEPNGGEGGEG